MVLEVKLEDMWRTGTGQGITKAAEHVAHGIAWSTAGAFGAGALRLWGG